MNGSNLRTYLPKDPPSEGLVAHYSFENDLKDSSGNGYHGVVDGNVSFVPSVRGGMALRFSNRGGVKGLVYINTPTALSAKTKMTLSFWILQLGDGIVFDGSLRLGGWAVNSQGQYFHHMTDRYDRHPHPHMAEIPRNTWTHVGIVKSLNTVKYYINGTRSSFASIIGRRGVIHAQVAASTTFISYLILGGLSNQTNLSQDQPTIESTSEGFEGCVDEVYIYNRLLTGSEVAVLSTTPPSTTTEKLTIYPSNFRLDDHQIDVISKKLDMLNYFGKH